MGWRDGGEAVGQSRKHVSLETKIPVFLPPCPVLSVILDCALHFSEPICKTTLQRGKLTSQGCLGPPGMHPGQPVGHRESIWKWLCRAAIIGVISPWKLTSQSHVLIPLPVGSHPITEKLQGKLPDTPDMVTTA